MNMKDFRGLLIVIERDIRNFSHYTWWVVGLMLMNITDLIILALSLNNLVVGFNYFAFLAPGITITSVFATSMILGQELNSEKLFGMQGYLLSLPVKRLTLITGRLLAGGLRSLTFSFPALIVALLAYQAFHPGIFFLAILLILITAASISGFSIIFGLIIKNHEKYMLFRSIISLFFMFASTVYYPQFILNFLPPFAIIAGLNPLSFSVNLLRFLLGGQLFSIFDLIGLLVFFFGMLATSLYVFDRSIEME
ncbi:MAG: ABC transporter permease [Candidatus Helarchaeota archaeon]